MAFEASSVLCVFGPQGPGQDEGDGPEWQIKVLSCTCHCCRIESCEFRHECLEDKVTGIQQQTSGLVKDLVESNRRLLQRVQGLECSNNKLVEVHTIAQDQHKSLKQRVETLEYNNSKLAALAAHFYEAYQRNKNVKRKIVRDPRSQIHRPSHADGQVPSEQSEVKRLKPDGEA